MHAKSLQSCRTLCNPKDCSRQSCPVRGILWARILQGLLCPSPRDLPDPGIQPESPMYPDWQVGSLPLMPPGKPLSHNQFSSVQFSSAHQSCLTLCDPMNHSTPGLPVHHQLPEFPQTHVHRVRDAIQPSHPLLSPFSPAPNPSQHQGLFQWVNSSHDVAKVLEFQPQHQSF